MLKISLRPLYVCSTLPLSNETVMRNFANPRYPRINTFVPFLKLVFVSQDCFYLAYRFGNFKTSKDFIHVGDA
jgi:hypothetical protein